MSRLSLAVLIAIAPLFCAAQAPAALDLFNRARAGDPQAFAQLRAAADAGQAESQFHLGRAYSHGAGVKRDDAEAARWVEKAAAQGHLEAQSNMGYIYSAGLGVPRDAEKAIAWWTRAAEGGFAQAQHSLALVYVQGKLAAKDEARAFAWASKAAAQGLLQAQGLLADFYRRGVGTEPNMKEAVAWYRKAADAGDSRASINLAVLHAQGEGVPLDPAEALRWARRAEAQGHPKAAALEGMICRGNPGLCERHPKPDHFVYEQSDPRIRVVIPDIPPISMGPHPLGQAHTRAMGAGPGGLTISVLVPTADQGTSALDCASSRAASVAQRFGVKREDAVVQRTNESTLVMLFPFKTDPLMQLKAFILSGNGTSHCVEVHLSKVLLPSEAVEPALATWMRGFRNARVELY